MPSHRTVRRTIFEVWRGVPKEASDRVGGIDGGVRQYALPSSFQVFEMGDFIFRKTARIVRMASSILVGASRVASQLPCTVLKPSVNRNMRKQIRAAIRMLSCFRSRRKLHFCFRERQYLELEKRATRGACDNFMIVKRRCTHRFRVLA